MNARLSQNLSANSTVDRCITPDSLIESGSDSASVIVTKKSLITQQKSIFPFLNNSFIRDHEKSTETNALVPSVGSEFGSLTSVNIAQEDDQDLDSGIGVQSGTLFAASDPENHRLFELRRIPTTEVIRRSTSNLNNNSLTQDIADSNWELNEADEMQGNIVPGYGNLAGQQQHPQQQYINNNNARQFVQAPLTNSITPSSRSMSNLHRANVSPQRTRRRWNVPAQQQPQQHGSFTSPNACQNFSPAQQITPTSLNMSQQNMIYSPNNNNTSSPYNNNSTTSFVDAAGGGNYAYLQQTPEAAPHWSNASAGYRNYTGSYSTVQAPPPNKNIDGVFERQTAQRNSFSKRYLNNVEEKTLWSPAAPINEQAKRRSFKTKNFGVLASSAAISSSVSEGHSRRRFQARDSHANSSFNRSGDLAFAQNTSSSRLLSRIKQQRKTTEIGNDVEASVFRSRSRSPSQLAMQYIAAGNKADSATPSPSSTVTRSWRQSQGPSSVHSTPSRSNMRLSSVTSNLPQTTNKLQEAREMLKKSQENLSAAADFCPTPLALLLSQKSLAQSIRDLRKNSNPDLTNENLFGEDTPDSNLVAQDSSNNQYYSTLPKNLRRGVQKKLDKSSSRFRNPAEQTTTSGDSDNNTPDISSSQRNGMTKDSRMNSANSSSPITTTFGGAGRTILNLPQRNEVPTRSVSSVESMGRFNRPGTRAYDQLNGISTRKTPNYLAQRFGMSDFGAPDMVENDDNCTARSQSSSIDLSSSLTNIAESDLLNTQTAKKMAMHASECIQEMTKATDKLLGTRQLINKDTSIEPAEKETLLAGVGRAIGCFRVRLDSALPEFSSSNFIFASWPAINCHLSFNEMWKWVSQLREELREHSKQLLTRNMLQLQTELEIDSPE
uniref:Uncharacterized protein n=1 Tax=Ditylenchus dipsaci TaxID=166011 RepID=A0A915EJ63_9BILA